MDRECLALLPRVCEVLADPKQSLPDDTSLEKLLDWLSGLTKDTGDRSLSRLEIHPCLTEFLSTVFHNKTTGPSILSFALRLTGLLAGREHGFRLLQEGSILGVAYNIEGWQEAGLWEDPCVRIGWIQGLRSMLQHRLALHFLVQRGLTKPLLQLQTDPSLFVASAANQLLAHLVVFFQPMGSSGEEGEAGQADASTDNSPEHLPVAMATGPEHLPVAMATGPEHLPVAMATSAEHLPVAMATGPEHLPVAMATSAEHDCVTVAITDHLEESLTSDKHLQTLQSLRLLGLLLAQARAPLWGTLLRRVPGLLEPLVRAGRSQLMPQLTDVLLTSYRLPVPDPTICRLLTSVLDSQNSSDAVHAAAATLRRNHRDPVHTLKAISILLLPLEILTGVPLLEPHTAGSSMKEQRPLLAEQLNSKSTCVSLLSVCLSCTQTLTHTVPDYLPTPAVSVIISVMSLLRICGGHAPSPIGSGKASCSAPIGRNKACGNLIGCSKIQRCGLDALANLSSCPGAAVEEVLSLLILYLQDPDSHPTVCKKTYQALLRWLGVCVSSPSVTHLLTEELLPVLRKRVCDVHWEVRDSTLEFLSQLAVVCEGSLGRSTTPLLTEALADPESYVRASAIAGLAGTLRLSLQQGAEPAVLEQVAIVPRLLEILSQDSEAFPRRAVVQFFITWLKTCPSSSSSWSLATPLQAVLQLGSADLDWEVKVHTLELAELLMEEALPVQRSLPGSNTHPYAAMPALTTHTPANTHTPLGSQYGGCGGTDLALALSGLVQTGVVRVLLNGLFDCDRPVVQQACGVLLALRRTLFPDGVTATGGVAMVTCDVRGQAWERDVVRKCLEMRRGRKGCDWPRQTGDSDRLDEVGSEAGDRSGEEVVCGGENVGVCEAGESVSVCEDVSVCEVLCSLALEDRHRVVSQSSDYVQNSPLSLLQDILTATLPTEEVIVDCY